MLFPLDTYQPVGMDVLMNATQPSARRKLLDAALEVVRTTDWARNPVGFPGGWCHQGAFCRRFKRQRELGVEATRTRRKRQARCLAYPRLSRFEIRGSAIAYIDFRRLLSMTTAFPRRRACSAPWCRRPIHPIRRCVRLAASGLKHMLQRLPRSLLLPNPGMRRRQVGRRKGWRSTRKR